MTKELLLKGLKQVEDLANGSKLTRLFHHPLKYIDAIFQKKIIYPFSQKEVSRYCNLFSGKKIKVLLPASTDIYLTGGKSHSSELRLAKFLILNLKDGNVFWDIGAHYGYFSMIAADLVAENGSVIALEAAPKTFHILKENSLLFETITAYNHAVTNHNEQVSFFEMPNLYSEYNTTDISQFENEEWFHHIKTQQININAVTLDNLFTKQTAERPPTIIKIDVEGGESSVIEGGEKLLSEHAPIIVMEYLEAKRNNQPHVMALAQLQQLGYQPHIIQEDGSITGETHIETHLANNKLESDNIVFIKNNAAHSV